MSEVLTQEEIDALRKAVSSGKVEALSGDEIAASAPAEVKVVGYDFRRPKLLSAERMQTLNVLHQTLAKNVQSLLFSMLKVTGEASLAEIDQVRYGEFLLSLENPTYLLGLNADSEMGALELELTPPMGQVLLDLLLGGDGVQAAQEPSREFSALELDLLRTFSDRFLNELETAWSSIQEIEFSVYAQGVVSDQVHIAPPDTPCLSVGLLLRIEEAEGRLNVCYPFSTLQSIFQRADTKEDELTGRRSEGRKEALRVIQPVPIPVHVELGKARITARELTHLKVGDVVRLEQRKGDPMTLSVGGRNMGSAQAGTYRGRLGATVTSLKHPKKKTPAAPSPSVAKKKGT